MIERAAIKKSFINATMIGFFHQMWNSVDVTTDLSNDDHIFTSAATRNVSLDATLAQLRAAKSLVYVATNAVFRAALNLK